MKKKIKKNIVLSSVQEKDLDRELVRCLRQTPIPEQELLANLGVFLPSRVLSRTTRKLSL